MKPVLNLKCHTVACYRSNCMRLQLYTSEFYIPTSSFSASNHTFILSIILTYFLIFLINHPSIHTQEDALFSTDIFHRNPATQNTHFYFPALFTFINAKHASEKIYFSQVQTVDKYNYTYRVVYVSFPLQFSTS